MNTQTTPIQNYTGHGWQGQRYDSSTDIATIAKKVKGELKRKYPGCKFSVTFQRYSGGRSLSISLVEADFPIFVQPSMEVASVIYDRYYCQKPEEFMEYWQENFGKHHQVNNYYIKDDYRLTEEGKSLMMFAKDSAQTFNYDDSDSQIDYFSTNFYLHLSIGKWDKPMIQK